MVKDARVYCLMMTLAVAASGCHFVQVSVTNPIPEMTTIAVAPFFNLSGEQTADGRRFAEAYFSELQKTPGFQVIPVGVVERAIQEGALEMSNPDDALRLAEILQADAVVVGAVTDYDPYYPPRIGLQVSWYSPYFWTFPAGVDCTNCLDETAAVSAPSDPNSSPHEPPPGDPDPRIAAPTPVAVKTNYAKPSQKRNHQQASNAEPTSATGALPTASTAAQLPYDPRKPLMSYTRMFDGAEADLVANLRDYVALSGDRRSGGWEAYLHRSEDFIRFTSHLMIVEMLTLHGGEAKRRFVFALGNHR